MDTLEKWRTLNPNHKNGKRIWYQTVTWKKLDLDVAYIVSTDGSKEIIEVFYQNVLLPNQFITDLIWNQLMDIINNKES